MNTASIAKEYIRQEHIDKIEKFLGRAQRATKEGYTHVSMSGIATTLEIQNVSLILQAIQSLGILKKRGERRGAMWFWSADGMPNPVMAERVFKEMERIKTNNDIEKRTNDSLKKKNYTPIVGSKRPNVQKKTTTQNKSIASHVRHVLDELYKNKTELINPAAMAKRHNVDQDAVFNTLIELNVIKAHERIPGQYLWNSSERPDDDMVELIMNVYPKEMTPLMMKIEDKRKRLLGILVALKGGFKGSLTNVFREAKLQSTYLSFAIKEKYIVNTGGALSPEYKLNVEPTMDAVLHLEQLVNADNKRLHNKGDKEDRAEEHSEEVKPEIKAEGTDLQSVFDRAVKRKKYLETELEKVNKIIDAVNTVNQFAFETNEQ